MDRSWKAFERRIAALVGGRRIPVTGERDGADVIAGPFVYQAKLRRGLPSYLRAWVRGIVAAGERKNAVGVVVWKAPRQKDDDALVVLRLRDFQELIGSQKMKPPGAQPGGSDKVLLAQVRSRFSSRRNIDAQEETKATEETTTRSRGNNGHRVAQTLSRLNLLGPLARRPVIDSSAFRRDSNPTGGLVQRVSPSSNERRDAQREAFPLALK